MRNLWLGRIIAVKKNKLCALSLSSFWIIGVHAEPLSDSSIQAIQATLAQQQVVRTQTEQNLAQLQAQISEASVQLAQTQKTRQAEQVNIKRDQQLISDSQTEIEHQKYTLETQFKMAYTHVFSDEKDDTQTYARYVILNQINKINALNQMIQQTDQQLKLLIDQESKYKNLEKTQIKGLADLKTAQTAQKVVLDRLALDMQQKNEEMSALSKQQNHSLEGVLKKIMAQASSYVAELKPVDPNTLNTRAMAYNVMTSPVEETVKQENIPANLSASVINTWRFNGRPVQGSIVVPFGSALNDAGTKMNGVVIGAAKGQPIYAVAPGRVVFADYMSGYGSLMIIDHGNGYMTLYGQNEHFYKQVGDWVVAGERIAVLGDPEAPLKSGLYFAIRKRGMPLNPALFLSDIKTI